MYTVKNPPINYLSQIDTIINFFRDNKNIISNKEKEQKAKELVKVILYEKGIQFQVVDKKVPLFDESISNYNKSFIAICLLRFWNADEKFFEDHIDFQRKTIKLIEEIVKNDLNKFKELSIKYNAQTYEKVNKYKDFYTELEDRFLGQVNFEYDINSIDPFKNKFLSMLGNNSFKSFISIFLPKNTQTKVEQIFAKTRTYLNSEASHKLHNFDDAMMGIQKGIDDAIEFNTTYCQTFVIKCFTKLKSLLQKDFDESPFCKPAFLNINAINKKYPFAQVNHNFKLGFEIFNSGEGYAYDVSLKVVDFTSDALYEDERLVGTIGFDPIIVELKCLMQSPAPDTILTLQVNWKNFDNIQCEEKFEFILPGQRNDIDWESLKFKDFYSIEPVETEDELIGRRGILNQLLSSTESKRVGSAYIYGQRRVGKSSIVKTLKTELEKLFPKEIIVYYAETGEYIDPNSNRTIDQLALNICKKIRSFNPILVNIPFPDFRGALSPITTYLNDVSYILPECKVLIILDEFDKIPSELYRKGEIGDAFFDTIRAISNKGSYGFLLVGGERMEYIVRDQSQELNKFRSIRVDYFDKSTNWRDFKDLVVKPIEDNFEITDEAINYIYDLTSGNPFFTKVICEEMIKLMIDRRDNHITKNEVVQASNIAVINTSEQTFAHFWKDGIRDVLVGEEEVAANRRKILIAIISIFGNKHSVTFDEVIDYAIIIGLSENTATATLEEFLDRDVLTIEDRNVDFKVKLFKNWLMNGGVSKLKTTLVESDRIEQEKVLNEKAKVQSIEIVSLVESWSSYRGSEITTDKVRSWLEQFGVNKNQRTMFKILANIRFYSDYEVKVKLGELFAVIRRSMTEQGKIRIIKGKEHTRKDVIVSYLEDTPAKSGSEYAKLFADENKIFHKNVVQPEKLEKYLANNNDVHSVIFVDDFLGTGNSAQTNILRLNEDYPTLFTNPEIGFFLGVICGFNDTKQKLTNKLKRQKINISLHLCDVLDDSDKIFDDSSKTFVTPKERHFARTICYDFGSKLVKNNALGYGNSQLAVVFPRTIPNNSLPILWASTDSWRPLFERPL